MRDVEYKYTWPSWIKSPVHIRYDRISRFSHFVKTRNLFEWPTYYWKYPRLFWKQFFRMCWEFVSVPFIKIEREER